MNSLKNFSRKLFLTDYWQKNICVFQKAYSNSRELISSAELAGLACEDDIEARIIFANSEQTQWACEYAPFEESYFSELKEKNWTLLVQAVDQYVPAVRDILNDFDFLPKWRVDDVMLSYATPGGGVGPHFDYYDVFLIQLSGSREWKIGQHCDSSTPLKEHPDLKLLNNFDESETHVLHQGDMLYIPAGIAHWGTAISEDCITASVGFRAPSHKELLQGALDKISSDFKEDQRYKDSTISIQDDKYLIPSSVAAQLEPIWDNLDKTKFIEHLFEQLSLQVSEVRDEDVFEPQNYSSSYIQTTTISHHPSSRFAYRNDESIKLYVNGEVYPANLETALAICHSDYFQSSDIDWDLVCELANYGYLLVKEN